MKKLACVVIYAVLFLFSGCQQQEQSASSEKVQYAVCKKSMIPKELQQLIDEEKKEACHFT